MTDQLTQQQREVIIEEWKAQRDECRRLARYWRTDAGGATARSEHYKVLARMANKAARNLEEFLNSAPVPEGVNLDFISEALSDFAELIRSGNVDGAGQFSPSDLQEQSDLLAAAPTPEDDYD